MKIQESQEDYMETILILQKEQEKVRSVDIANKLGYSKPTISIAIKKFREEDLVDVDGKGYVSLTEKGLSIAEKTFEKHNLLARMLMSLGVCEKTAFQDACHIEHCLSDESFNAIKSHWQENNK